MAKRHIPESHGGHPNVTPLIDVVMVLIVFFMLVARIGVNTGADKDIVIPKSILGTDIKDLGNTLVLNVSKNKTSTTVTNDPHITALVKGGLQDLKIVDPVTRKQQLEET